MVPEGDRGMALVAYCTGCRTLLPYRIDGEEVVAVCGCGTRFVLSGLNAKELVEIVAVTDAKLKALRGKTNGDTLSPHEVVH